MVTRLIKAGFVVVLALLIYDLGWREFQAEVNISRQGLPKTDFLATLMLSGLRYDAVSHSVRANVTMLLSVLGLEDINNVSLTLNDGRERTLWLFADSSHLPGSNVLMSQVGPRPSGAQPEARNTSGAWKISA